MRRVNEENPESSRIMLGLLDAVEQDRAQSQRLLASELGIALGLVNAYIKRCIKKGLVKVRSAEEVLEHAGAFLQLYREEGHYLERTVHFVGRVGLDYVKKRVLEDAPGRRALWERLQFALEGEPDPWRDPAKAGIDLRQFEALRA